MKRLFSILLILTLVFLAAGCSQQPKEEAVLPPTRTGAGTMHMSLMVDYTLESAFEEADAVVRVEIGDWLGENTEYRSTYFEATVLECFKGEIPEVFTLMQEGCSAVTQYRYPLFTAGNELLLFLNEAQDDHGFDSVYWIAGAFTTTIDVAYDEEGNRYYADRYGILCQDFSGCKDYAQNLPLMEELGAYLAEVDPLFETMDYPFSYVYAGTELKGMLEDL